LDAQTYQRSRWRNQFGLLLRVFLLSAYLNRIYAYYGLLID
jgi:hypothetical protein